MKYVIIFLLFLGTNAFAMNKGELIEAMAKSSGLSKADSKRALDGFEKSVEKMLRKREDVSIGGFGTIYCKAKEKANKTKCGLSLRMSNTGVKSLVPRYIDNFFTSMTSIMANSVNNKQYLCYDGKDNDCDGIDDDCNKNGIDNDCDGTSDSGSTRARDYNSSRSNTTSLMLSAMGDGVSSCYKDGNLYEEVYSDKERIIAKNRCVRGIMNSLRTKMKDCEDCLWEEEFENLSALAKSGIDSFFDIFTEFRDDDSDGDSILVENISKKSGLSKADAKRALDGFVSSVLGALRKGDSVKLAGFGSFSISKRAARTGRNPQTGKEIKISAKNVVRFKAGSELSEKVN
jgi:DNA-binding protein HU-beta